ncbi:MAG: enoyl-CoA hydratase/isomerase family protein [Chloroflexi bacterium]|nr:enoyl-CoA hydratase/isomerase family protein [Chloroflexota bacterium]
MSSYEHILCERTGNVARITFNRPEKLNAWPFQGGMTADFHAALTEAEEDDDVKVVVLRGAGRCFSAGHDLAEVGLVYGYGTGQQGERRPSQRIRLKIDREGFDTNHRRVLLFPKITIAQIHGYCIGEGLILTECCDLAVAAEDAQLAHADQRMGFAGSGIGVIPILIATVGLKRALDLLLTGRMISGREALDIGLVNQAVPADDLDDAVERLVEALCKLPRDGIAIGKAHRALTYDALGLTAGFAQGSLTHTLFTNLRWEPDEYNFFKHRRDAGLRKAIHQRDERYGDLV